MIFSSSLEAWPDTWMAWLRSYTTSAPQAKRRFTVRLTSFSFPGMGVAEMTTRSLGPSRICRCSPLLMSTSPEKGSPWLPVVSTTNRFGGVASMSCWGMNRSSDASTYPSFRASST